MVLQESSSTTWKKMMIGMSNKIDPIPPPKGGEGEYMNYRILTFPAFFLYLELINCVEECHILKIESFLLWSIASSIQMLIVLIQSITIWI